MLSFGRRKEICTETCDYWSPHNWNVQENWGVHNVIGARAFHFDFEGPDVCNAGSGAVVKHLKHVQAVLRPKTVSLWISLGLCNRVAAENEEPYELKLARHLMKLPSMYDYFGMGI